MGVELIERSGAEVLAQRDGQALAGGGVREVGRGEEMGGFLTCRFNLHRKRSGDGRLPNVTPASWPGWFRNDS